MSKRGVEQNASYLRDAVYAASDGVVTTFAIVAGVTGASLSSNIILILGIANLFADGFSMAASNYLGIKSETEYKKSQGDKTYQKSSITNPTITLISFIVAGAVPLLPFLLKSPNALIISAVLVGVTMFAIGAARSRFTKSSWIKSGMETLAVGTISAIVAFSIGLFLDRYVI